MTKKIASYIPAACWFILTIVLLTLPGSTIPKENWLDKIWADKWVHIVLFGILVILWCRAISISGGEIDSLKKYFILVAVSGIAYGIGMEFVQKHLVSNRSFDIGDIVADTIGCLAGLLFSWKSYIKK